ncbi:MAG: NeuD/PglB/VioB family sugar acetyltransferase [Cyclobacteriaceae bacterium]|nr:NeuD/PglB/VioB family sugar acetyltransferase [Cyclobacteriaceae bacterium]
MDNPVMIFGTNTIGRAAKDIFESNGVTVYGFLDDDTHLHQKEIDDVLVLGTTDDDGLLKLIPKKCEAFVACDENKLRKTLVSLLQERRHVQPVNGIHKLANLSPRSSIGHGNFIDAGVTAAPGVQIGSHCLIHGNVWLGVGTIVSNFAQIGAGSIVNAGVTIEEEAFIGSGVTVVAGVTIGKGARIGAGSVVIGPVKAGETVFGNPAQKVQG